MTDIEINRINAEILKLITETAKLASERPKLDAETAKLQRERAFYPFAVGAAVMGAATGLAALVFRLLGA